MEGVRYTVPSKYDLAPYGHVCKVMQEERVNRAQEERANRAQEERANRAQQEENYQFFIQISKDESTAHWIPIGHLLEKAFYFQILDEMFIKECLTLYEGKSDYKESLQILGNIFKRY